MIGFASKFRKTIIHNDTKRARDTNPKQQAKKQEEPKEESSD